jgi:hypothetical protein
MKCDTQLIASYTQETKIKEWETADISNDKKIFFFKSRSRNDTMEENLLYIHTQCYKGRA